MCPSATPHWHEQYDISWLFSTVTSPPFTGALVFEVLAVALALVTYYFTFGICSDPAPVACHAMWGGGGGGGDCLAGVCVGGGEGGGIA